jgi:hypothetical protein
LREPVVGSIGVKIDSSEPWADGFRLAFGFWNSVLDANLHEETDIDACSVRIIDGDTAILSGSVAARSQIINWANFRGKIAVSPFAAREMNSAEVYATAVHELGHMLGLKHNTSNRSIMYFLDVDGTEVLDGQDILRAEQAAHAAAANLGEESSADSGRFYSFGLWAAAGSMRSTAANSGGSARVPNT